MGNASIETIGGWLEKAEVRLYAEEVESPRLSAHLILEFAAARPRALLPAHFEETLASSDCDRANELLDRRLEHEPMAYLLGKKEFRNLTLTVSPGVLIPRPETESLVDLALRFKPDARSILDAGTGSGCLALSLVEEYPRSRIVGCDYSPHALELARENDKTGKVGWVQSRWLEPFKEERFDLIVSNPPYLTTEEMESLDRQVKDYEPTQALHGGEDGCDSYRILIPQAWEALEVGGVLILETSPSVKEGVAGLLRGNRFEEVEILNDLAGRERYARAAKSRNRG
jgi:release factor glutamine methyltransferase